MRKPEEILTQLGELLLSGALSKSESNVHIACDDADVANDIFDILMDVVDYAPDTE